jgi:hypothetical protein
VQLPELIRIIKQQILPQWQEMDGVWDMEMIENLSNDLITLGKVHQVPIFIDYGVKLCELSKQFNITNIEQTFHTLYEIMLTFINKLEHDA